MLARKQSSDPKYVIEKKTHQKTVVRDDAESNPSTSIRTTQSLILNLERRKVQLKVERGWILLTL
jgi:hypothetical protein